MDLGSSSEFEGAHALSTVEKKLSSQTCLPPPTASLPPPHHSTLQSSSSSSPSSSNSPPVPISVPEVTCLKDCTIFIDIWMSNGQETSALYVKIAKSMGAQIIKSLVLGCTHLVFTSGWETTVKKYLFIGLDEAKRLTAVGAAWLRAYRIMAMHADKRKYAVDMEEYWPSKMFNDRGEKVRCKDYSDMSSMDGLDFSFICGDDEDLTPLEQARLRWSMKGHYKHQKSSTQS
ncbi:hypothetical protein GYMLUDRAFT_239417 [Collybiopsis luxurians FD-317 M1]|nr:hypothetical protein GYMLUDRAFT_239417 [Collybiopsis luxurians FD-317 M1]